MCPTAYHCFHQSKIAKWRRNTTMNIDILTSNISISTPSSTNLIPLSRYSGASSPFYSKQRLSLNISFNSITIVINNGITTATTNLIKDIFNISFNSITIDISNTITTATANLIKELIRHQPGSLVLQLPRLEIGKNNNNILSLRFIFFLWSTF